MFGRRKKDFIAEEPLHEAALRMVAAVRAGGETASVWAERLEIGDFDFHERTGRASAFWVEAMGTYAGLHQDQAEHPLVSGGIERARRLCDRSDEAQGDALARVERLWEQETQGA